MAKGVLPGRVVGLKAILQAKLSATQLLAALAQALVVCDLVRQVLDRKIAKQNRLQ